MVARQPQYPGPDSGKTGAGARSGYCLYAEVGWWVARLASEWHPGIRSGKRSIGTWNARSTAPPGVCSAAGWGSRGEEVEDSHPEIHPRLSEEREEEALCSCRPQSSAPAAEEAVDEVGQVHSERAEEVSAGDAGVGAAVHRESGLRCHSGSLPKDQGRFSDPSGTPEGGLAGQPEDDEREDEAADWAAPVQHSQPQLEHGVAG